MATFTYRNHNGISPGYVQHVRNNVYTLVNYAARNVPWNLLGTAPSGFVAQTTGTTLQHIHLASQTVFTASFQMQFTGAQQRWENHAVSGGFRLDLQGITLNWANWAIQTQGTNSVTVATCLMKVNKSFSQGQLAHALIQSADRNQICELT